MTTIQEFIERNGITAKVTIIENHPSIDWSDSWNATAHHWYVTLKRTSDKRRMTVIFHTGSALHEAPTTADVLDNVASDASTVENARDFSDWCNELGYDTDSRKAERIYKATVRQTERLKAFIGAPYQELLWDIERL